MGKPSSTCKSQVLDALREFGHGGALTTDLIGKCRFSTSRTGEALQNLVADGLVGFWPEPSGRCTTRRRWWAIEHLPATKPEPRPVTPKHALGAGPVRTVAPSYTHDKRFQCAPGERIVGGFASMGIGRYLDMGSI